MTRSHVIQLRVSKSEMDALRAHARALGLSLSAYLRLQGLQLLASALPPPEPPPQKRGRR